MFIKENYENADILLVENCLAVVIKEKLTT